MTTDFAAAMRRATELTRAFNPTEATKVIQAALSGRARPVEAPLEKQPAKQPQVDTAPRASQSKMLGARILRPLSEVVRTLKEGRKAVIDAPCFRDASPVVPDGAQFLTRSFTCQHGTRQFKLFIPKAEGVAAPRGLIVMLHGCKQNPDDFAVGTKMNEVAMANNFIVAYPSQPSSANAGACWNWFVPAHQMRDRGEPAILAGLTRELMLEFSLDRDQVYVAGLSAGGAMAAIMLETYPDIFSRAGIHSGLAYRSANDVMSAFAAMSGQEVVDLARARAKSPYPSKLIIFHGDADRTVHRQNARTILAQHVDAEWTASQRAGHANGADFSQAVFSHGTHHVEVWTISGAGHAWSGGDPRGSFASASGPNASAEMVRFFVS